MLAVAVIAIRFQPDDLRFARAFAIALALRLVGPQPPLQLWLYDRRRPECRDQNNRTGAAGSSYERRAPSLAPFAARAPAGHRPGPAASLSNDQWSMSGPRCERDLPGRARLPK